MTRTLMKYENRKRIQIVINFVFRDCKGPKMDHDGKYYIKWEAIMGLYEALRINHVTIYDKIIYTGTLEHK